MQGCFVWNETPKGIAQRKEKKRHGWTDRDAAEVCRRHGILSRRARERYEAAKKRKRLRKVVG